MYSVPKRWRAACALLLISAIILWPVARDYAAAGGPSRPDVLPTFGSDGPMNSDTTNDPQYDTGIAVNPSNGQIAVGAVSDLPGSGDLCAYTYRTTNGGNNWTPVCPGTDTLEPGMAYSPDGAYVYEIVKVAGAGLYDLNLLERSTNNGMSWQEFYPPANYNDNTYSTYLWVDHSVGPNRGYLYVTWTEQTPDLKAHIELSRSTDQGVSWSTPAVIATGYSYSAGSYPLVDFASAAPLPSGDVVVAYLKDNSFSGGTGQEIDTARSTDGGLTFAAANKMVSVPLNNSVSSHEQLPNKQFEASATPMIAADPVNGKLYAVWAEYRQIRSQAGIYLASSTDEGLTWSSSILVSPSTTQDQFMPWLSVSPNHTIHITWGDSSVDPHTPDTSNANYRWYYADSTDGGSSFEGPTRLASATSNGSAVSLLSIGQYAENYVNADTIYSTWPDTRNYSTRDIDGYAVRGSFCQNPFVDIAGNAYYAAIEYLYCANVVSGTDPTHFSPGSSVTRAQVAKMVTLAFGAPLYTPPAPTFSDVSTSYFAYAYIETVNHNDWMTGYTGTTCTDLGLTSPCFLPNSNATRDQVVKAVVAAGRFNLIDPPTPTYSDVPSSYWAYQYIETAHQKGLINWIVPPTFNPHGIVQRDQMSQTLYSALTTQR